VLAAPDSVVEHVFGGKVRSGDNGLSAFKTRNAVYGRLRFVLKLLRGTSRRVFLRNYLGEDRSNLLHFARKREWPMVRAYVLAWGKTLTDLLSIRRAHRDLGRRARANGEALFDVQAGMPAGLIWNGLPELSRETIAAHYLPLFEAGRTRAVAEFPRQAVTSS
jgi:hypothetical protein